MKRRHRGAPLERTEPISEVAALELRIEEAWLRLTAFRQQQAVTVYLTDSARIAGIGEYIPRAAGKEVGTYNRKVTLADFRADVFWTFEQMRKAA